MFSSGTPLNLLKEIFTKEYISAKILRLGRKFIGDKNERDNQYI